MFVYVTNERSLLLLLSLKDPGLLKKPNFTVNETNIIKKPNLALEKIHRKRMLKENTV